MTHRPEILDKLLKDCKLPLTCPMSRTTAVDIACSGMDNPNGYMQ
jgi:hypothetical protein